MSSLQISTKMMDGISSFLPPMLMAMMLIFTTISVVEYQPLMLKNAMNVGLLMGTIYSKLTMLVIGNIWMLM